MAKTYVLDRVAADLARGYTHPAIQRLSSLVAAYPNDLDLRRRLAAVHRRVGNRIQAGRWDYLTIGADSTDTQAFERAFPSALARLRQVRWPYRASEAATAYARSRLAKLTAAAQAERRPATAPATADLPVAALTAAPATRSVRNAVGGRRFGAVLRRPLRAARTRTAVTIASAIAAPLAAVGAATVVEWIVQ
jgi:hypothetical protein